MMYIFEAEFLDDTSPVQMDKSVNDRKDDKNEKNDEGKEAECLDDTSHIEMDERVNDRNDNKNENNDEEKEAEF